jgi:D-serine deaminase-like pyridoxal phosphate-dependent protein
MAFEALDPAGYRLPESLLARVQTPALVVHIDRVRGNLARVLALCGGDPLRWRAHVKSTKIPRVLAELARAGLRRFKCATTRELAVLLETLELEGVRDGDVLLAYPLVGPGLARVAELAARHPQSRLSVLCDVPEAVAEVPRGVGVFVDLNPGMDRTGIPLERSEVVRATLRAAGERLGGVHFYDGHLHQADPAERRRAAHAGYARLASALDALERDAPAVPEVVSAGTPALLDALAFTALARPGRAHTVSPGTVVYHDLRSELETPALGLAPAALVLARVVSHPAAGRVTCDAGSKSLAAEAGDPCAVALGRPELVAGKPSEEHLPFDGPPDRLPARGEVLQLVPRHVCPTVNLAEEALIVERGALLEVAPVSARAHELLLA